MNFRPSWHFNVTDSRPLLLLLTQWLFHTGAVWGFAALNALLLNEYGVSALAIGLLLAGLGTILATLIYSQYASKLPLAVMLWRLTLITAAIAAVGGLLLLTGWRKTSLMTLFALSEALAILWLAHWRTTVTGYLDHRARRRWLPIFDGGQLAGFVTGGVVYLLLTGAFAVRAETMLLLWIAALLLIALLVYAATRNFEARSSEDSTTESGVLVGLSHIRQSPYLQHMALAVALMAAWLTLLQFLSANHLLAFYDDVPSLLREQNIGGFFALIDIFGALLLPLQNLFFSRLLNRYGLAGVNLVYPVLSLIVGIAFLLFSTRRFAPVYGLLLAGIAHFHRTTLRRVLRSSVHVRLYQAVPPFMKVHSRTVINGILAPSGVVLTAVFTLFMPVITLTLLLVVLALAYIWSARRLQRQYITALLAMIRQKDYSVLLTDAYDAGQADRETRQLLEQRLKDETDPDYQLFLAAILVETGGEEAVPGLLEFAQQADEDTRLAVMDLLVESDSLTPTAQPFLERYAQTEDWLTRRTAILGLMKLHQRSPKALIALADSYLTDPDHVIRGRMIPVLMQQGDLRQQHRARTVLTGLLYAPDSETRTEGIHALVATGDVDAIRELVKFLQDGDDDVRVAAVQGIETLWKPGLSQELIDVILSHEDKLLDDPIERVRQVELNLLRYIGNEAACAALVHGLTDASPIIRRAALNALVDMGGLAESVLLQTRASEPKNIPLLKQATLALGKMYPERYRTDVLVIIAQLVDTLYLTTSYIAALHLCQRYSFIAILTSHYEEQNAVLLDEVFFCIGVLHGEAAAASLLHALSSTDKTHHENAIETLAGLISPEIARRIAPLCHPENTPERLVAQPLRSAGDILRELANGKDSWLRAVAVMALGEIGADTPQVRRYILEDNTIPLRDLDRCQRAVPPELVSVLIRGALASSDADVRRAAHAAFRLIRGQDMLEVLAEHGENSMLATIERMIYLKRISYFATLSVAQLKAVATICDEKLFRKDEVLFHQNDPGGVLYIVLSGTVEVGLHGKQGEGFIRLATYTAGSTFGEMSLFDNSPRSAEAVAKQDTLTLLLRREPFVALARQYPDLSLQLMTTLSQRLRHANTQIAELSSTLHQPQV